MMCVCFIALLGIHPWWGRSCAVDLLIQVRIE
jgi:hypothetical protein